MTVSIRKRILQLHRWVGLTVGLLIVLVAVTGAANLYRPQLDPIVNHRLLRANVCATLLPVDTLVASARTANPNSGALKVIQLDNEPGSSIHIRFSDENWVYVDPCTATVLGQEHRYGGVFGTIDALHRFKFVQNSSVMSGTLATITALILVLGGLIVWWPASIRSFKHSLKLNSRLQGRAFSLNLHKTVAIYAGPILLVSALTGIPQAFLWCQNGILALTGSPPQANPGKSFSAHNAKRLPIETYWQQAQALVPRPRATLLFYPKKPSDPVEFELIDRNAPHGAARTYVSLDAYSGKVLRFTPYAKASSGHRLYLWMVALHTGLLGGAIGQFLLLLGVLSVPVLAYAGFSSYLLGLRRTRMAAPTRVSGGNRGSCNDQAVE